MDAHLIRYRSRGNWELEPVTGIELLNSIGSSGRVRRRGARNMKSMWPPLATIFFMTYFYRAGVGGMVPSASPGYATAQLPRVAPDTHEW